jgi:hydrogenase expression/formation protein HypE
MEGLMSDRRPDKVLLAHGSGGQLSHELVERLFLKYFDNPILARLDDAAVIGGVRLLEEKGISGKLAFTTDSYVVSPVFFPGGDIGKLAVCGTVNDLAMGGAVPLYLSAGFILEEGLLLADLERVVDSMAATARGADVQIVTGDTKVVDRGKADRLFINTTGVGVVPAGVEVSGDRVRPGDVVILSGTIGDHGITIMSQREGLRFDSPLVSDCAPLHGLVAAMLDALSPPGGDGPREELRVGAVRCLRDPTRGGLTTVLNEVADKSSVGIEVEETAVPVRDEVRAACELLGLDPLYVANEGKLVAFVSPGVADAVLAAMRAHEYGREAAIIGEVTAEHAGRVVLRTALGARRILDMLVGEQLPRIC